MNIVQLDPHCWPELASEIIAERISSFLLERAATNIPYCNLFITGGNTVKKLYPALSKSKVLNGNARINFYLTDERMPSAQSDNLNDRNSEICSKFLLNNLTNKNIYFYPIFHEDIDVNDLINIYQDTIPESIDIVILSLGDDGHIASIFEHDLDANENIFEYIMKTESPNHKYQRISITYKLLNKAKYIYIIATGDNKKPVLKQIQDGDLNNTSVTKKLASRAIWISTF
jgi:6-phosphogluconolactonase